MPISKELFVEVIENIREQEAKMNRFSKALNEICDGHPLMDVNNLYLHSLLKVLESIFHDNYDTISWFLWEDVEKKIWLADGTEIDVSTPEKLYDYLIDCMIENGIDVKPSSERESIIDTESIAKE